MSFTEAAKPTRPNANDKKYLVVWFDDLKGIKLNENNAAQVAKWIGPNAHMVKVDDKNLVRVETNRGDVIMAIGDFITRDADNRFKIVRITETNERPVAAVHAAPRRRAERSAS